MAVPPWPAGNAGTAKKMNRPLIQQPGCPAQKTDQTKRHQDAGTDIDRAHRREPAPEQVQGKHRSRNAEEIEGADLPPETW